MSLPEFKLPPPEYGEWLHVPHCNDPWGGQARQQRAIYETRILDQMLVLFDRPVSSTELSCLALRMSSGGVTLVEITGVIIPETESLSFSFPLILKETTLEVDLRCLARPEIQIPPWRVQFHLALASWSCFECGVRDVPFHRVPAAEPRVVDVVCESCRPPQEDWGS